MGQKTCPSCWGSGSYRATERIPNPAGGMFQEISVTKSCGFCGGLGTIWAPDPPPSYGQGKQSPASPTTSKRKDGPGMINDLHKLGMWWVERLWPLRVLERFGQNLMSIGWKMKVPLAVLGAVIGGGFFERGVNSLVPWLRVGLLDLAGEWAPLLAIVLGGVCGWIFLTLLGGIAIFSINLIALGIGILIVGLVIALLSGLVAVVAGWPPFDRATSLSQPEVGKEAPHSSQ